MDLVDLIEKRRFVGREFLVWLWFESELFETRFDLKGIGPLEVVLESQITLVQEKEQSQLKGAMPSSQPEAREALRQGKMPTRARVRITRGELAWAFLFNADGLATSAVKIPAVIKNEEDEQFYERMYLVEELETLLGTFYAEFMSLRLSEAWDAQIVPAIRAWAHDEPTIDAQVYKKLKSKVAPLSKDGAKMVSFGVKAQKDDADDAPKTSKKQKAKGPAKGDDGRSDRGPTAAHA
jgi:hypothetical protein